MTATKINPSWKYIQEKTQQTRHGQHSGLSGGLQNYEPRPQQSNYQPIILKRQNRKRQTSNHRGRFSQKQWRTGEIEE